MRFSNIIVAVDVHDANNGQAALARAAAIAGDDGQLHLIYVRYYLPTRYSALIVENFDQQERDEAMATMKTWCARLGIDPKSVDIETRRGRVRDEVLSAAQRHGADLIVIGSHQPSLSSKLLGSNASAIVQQSPVSVLVVRASAG
ncbi:universal stress protein G [Sphingobium fontiphilum]|uniref:Universal stress protein n=1 Tax=Sphingobium fontiphilum TaxID=944425 RepID=A0A7W6GQF9_9SPHN|nr:universal stress protein [Sphingobium fontiphilum]MBB3983493.1 universal stress protein G [Sphingobium fontiphilum]